MKKLIIAGLTSFVIGGIIVGEIVVSNKANIKPDVLSQTSVIAKETVNDLPTITPEAIVILTPQPTIIPTLIPTPTPTPTPTSTPIFDRSRCDGGHDLDALDECGRPN